MHFGCTFHTVINLTFGLCSTLVLHSKNGMKTVRILIHEHKMNPLCTNEYFLLICYEEGSICNENPFITPSTNAIGSYAICQTKDQRVAVKMVNETLFYLSKFNKLNTFYKAH